MTVPARPVNPICEIWVPGLPLSGQTVSRGFFGKTDLGLQTGSRRAALLDVDIKEARQNAGTSCRPDTQYKMDSGGTQSRSKHCGGKSSGSSGKMTCLGWDYARLAGTFAWALDVMRQRGRERDHGPSR